MLLSFLACKWAAREIDEEQKFRITFVVPQAVKVMWKCKNRHNLMVIIRVLLFLLLDKGMVCVYGSKSISSRETMNPKHKYYDISVIQMSTNA